MPSPLAHVGIALALRLVAAPRASPVLDRVAVAASVASVVPDLDMLLVLALPVGLAWHHGPSHSLLGAAIGGWAVGRLARVDRRGLAICAVAGLSHAPMDYLTGVPGAPASYGVPLLWPVVAERFIAPHPWFTPFNIDREGFLWHMVSPEAARVYAREAVTVAVAGLFALVVRLSRAR